MGGDKYFCDLMKHNGGFQVPEEQYKGKFAGYTNKITPHQYYRGYHANSSNQDNTCGLNALNIAWRVLGYAANEQFAYEYYKPIMKFGLGPRPRVLFQEKIRPYFDYCQQYMGPNMPWQLIDGTNFQNEVIIVLTAFQKWNPFGGLHYILIIGTTDDKNWYFLTDHGNKIYFIHKDNLTYIMRVQVVPSIDRFNAFRMGKNEDQDTIALREACQLI